MEYQIQLLRCSVEELEEFINSEAKNWGWRLHTIQWLPDLGKVLLTLEREVTP